MYRKVFYALSALSLIYWVALLLKTGLAVWFNHIWLMAALAFFAASKVSKPKYRKLISIVLALCILIAGAGSAQLAIAGNQKPAADADYIIILGAQVYPGGGPSPLLRYRLEAAEEYCSDNPDTTIIVSGGKGGNEPISEAECMNNWLLEQGIDRDRIILEDKSTNTQENMKFSKALMNSQDDSVVIVTNSFHVFRAMKLSEKEGFKNATGLGAYTTWSLAPNYYLRELAALIKDLVL